MSALNKVILIGRLGKDPESIQTQRGNFAKVSLATDEKWRDKNTGEKRQATEWHQVIFFNRTAEVAINYLIKGMLICVEGKIKTRKYTDNQGVERYTTQIIADTLKMLESRREQQTQQTNNYVSPQPVNNDFDDDADIPF